MVSTQIQIHESKLVARSRSHCFHFLTSVSVHAPPSTKCCKYYECGSKEMIQLCEIPLKAPVILGARFSGAGFMVCCLKIVESERVEDGAAYIRAEYEKAELSFPHPQRQEG